MMLHRSLSALANRQGGIVRIRPALTMSLPRSEVASVSRCERDNGEFDSYIMDVNLQGLYGALSPLPNFYTEDLLQANKEDQLEMRAFLDIFNQQSYSLLLAAMQKHSAIFSLTDEGADSGFLQILWSLVGLCTRQQRDGAGANTLFLRYLRLFAASRRSASGLQVILEDFFPGTVIDIEQCVERKVRVSQGFQLTLGSRQHALGTSALLGNQVLDHSGKCRITIGPIAVERFRRLVNEGSEWSMFVALLTNYLKGSLVCELVFVIRRQDAKTTELGSQQWGQLGVDSWMYSQHQSETGRDFLVATQLLG